ncbi:MAG: class I SAM-dependent methyltransferase [Actinomycetota bacterium]
MYTAAWAASGYAAAHSRPGPIAHFFERRIETVAQLLRDVPGGPLLDAGSGPGMMVRHLVDRRPGDFEITALDRSEAMIDEARTVLGDDMDGVKLCVGNIERMPFPAATFDAVLAMGVLEYVDVVAALREVARVTRPGGVAVVTMLNPRSPYRIWERFVHHPVCRARAIGERLLGVPRERRRGAARNCAEVLGEEHLARLVRAVGLHPVSTVYFDFNPLPPPIDHLVADIAVAAERRLARLAGTPVRRLGSSFALGCRREGPPTTATAPARTG